MKCNTMIPRNVSVFSYHSKYFSVTVFRLEARVPLRNPIVEFAKDELIFTLCILVFMFVLK